MMRVRVLRRDARAGRGEKASNRRTSLSLWQTGLVLGHRDPFVCGGSRIVGARTNTPDGQAGTSGRLCTHNGYRLACMYRNTAEHSSK